MPNPHAVAARPAAEIEMFLDVSCPWCHGALTTMRRLLDELAGHPASPTIMVRWRVLRLHDNLPAAGRSVDDYLRSVADSETGVAKLKAEILEYTESGGAIVDHDRAPHLYDPLLAHRMLALARDYQGATGVPDMWALARAVWSANFTRGVDISNLSALRRDLEEAGLRLPEPLWCELADPAGYRDVTLADRQRALDIGLDGVPRWRIGDAIVPTWHSYDTVRHGVYRALGISSASGS